MSRSGKLDAHTENLHGQRTAHAVAVLRGMIVEGELPPGARISEMAICDRYGLSRTPLREALKVLAAEGLIDLRPNRGAVVTDLSPDDIEAVIHVLIGLEAMATDEICRRITDADIAALERMQAEMTACYRAGNLRDYFGINLEIHDFIIARAGNPALERIYCAESARIRRYRFLSNKDPRRWSRALREHEMILDALRVRDPDLLRRLLRVHLLKGWRSARKILDREAAARSNPTALPPAPRRARPPDAPIPPCAGRRSGPAGGRGQG